MLGYCCFVRVRYVLIWTLRSSNGITVNVAGVIHIYMRHDVCVRQYIEYPLQLCYVFNTNACTHAPYFVRFSTLNWLLNKLSSFVLFVQNYWIQFDEIWLSEPINFLWEWKKNDKIFHWINHETEREDGRRRRREKKFGQEWTKFHIYHIDARVQRRAYQAYVWAVNDVHTWVCLVYVRMGGCVYVSVCGEIDRNLYNRSCVEIDTVHRSSYIYADCRAWDEKRESEPLSQAAGFIIILHMRARVTAK